MRSSIKFLIFCLPSISASLYNGEKVDYSTPNGSSMVPNHLRRPNHIDVLSDNTARASEETSPLIQQEAESTVLPSSNSTTISPAPSMTPTPMPSENKTDTPTTAPPTTAPPTTSPPATMAPTHRHHHHDWWGKVWRLILKTVCWSILAVLFFFAFGAAMSNRYRIYYFLRGRWYSFYHKLTGRSSDAVPSATLNDIIFSDDTLRDGLLMRET